MAIISVIIFIFVIGVIISERMHRTAAAAIGAVALLIFKILDLNKAIGYIDFNTIGVLVGMMTFVAVMKESGVFEYVAIKSAKMTHGDPWKIMIVFTIITAVLSAFLDNVTTVLLVGPMTITISKMLNLNPIPFLMGQIFASNIGGTATLIGDPPNIMIGSAGEIPFLKFVTHTGVVAVFAILLLIVMMAFLYKKDLVADERSIESVMRLDEKKAISDKPLMIKSIVMTVAIVIAFMLHDRIGYETCVIALSAGAIMLAIGKKNVDNIIEEIEWTTLLFFISLFVVIGGMQETGVIQNLAHWVIDLTKGHDVFMMLLILWASALISSIIDNIPFVATLIPLIHAMGQDGINVMPLWWAVSLGACLGGNGTLIGASANVVLSGISDKNGYPITFKKYLKVGFPFMIGTIVLATVYLLLMYMVFWS